MKTHKHVNLLVVLALLLALTPVLAVTAAPAPKVDVCHFDKDTGVYFKINISENAFQAHVDHGDAAPGDPVPGLPQKKFTDDCSIVWAIPQRELKETLTIYPNDVPVQSMTLDLGQRYEFVASGTFTYNNAGDWADAEWYLKNGSIVKGDSEGSVPHVLDVSINGYSINTNWGDYRDSHSYTIDFLGAGVPITFSIYDSVTSDNKGFLTVDIYQVNW